ncbi:hypothetical protein cyc_01762 [Cyclospora cayetanensis]|uniref:Uncharacterized protein n=1 Tax=Cyclospora cayetanensis TaxID=88456 RepID=A0A1D3CUS6_9EIME|nr:hypothetical protein cyc_01762 [Cyclospora cayetanensis]
MLKLAVPPEGNRRKPVKKMRVVVPEQSLCGSHALTSSEMRGTRIYQNAEVEEAVLNPSLAEQAKLPAGQHTHHFIEHEEEESKETDETEEEQGKETAHESEEVARAWAEGGDTDDEHVPQAKRASLFAFTCASQPEQMRQESPLAPAFPAISPDTDFVMRKEIPVVRHAEGLPQAVELHGNNCVSEAERFVWHSLMMMPEVTWHMWNDSLGGFEPMTDPQQPFEGSEVAEEDLGDYGENLFLDSFSGHGASSDEDSVGHVPPIEENCFA